MVRRGHGLNSALYRPPRPFLKRWPTHVHDSEPILELVELTYEASAAVRKLPSAQAKEVGVAMETSSGVPAVDDALNDTQAAVVEETVDA